MCVEYFARDIERTLKEWKNRSNHNALLVEGSRQVGKTTTIRYFCEKEYSDFIEINLATFEREDFIHALKSSTMNGLKQSIAEYCDHIGLRYEDSNETVIFIDEIQEDKDVFAMIRQINRELKCDLIVSGSYLKRAENFFYPAGDLEVITMYPMSFPEFLDIYGARAYYESFDIFDKELSSDRNLSWFNRAYNNYKVIGGYPAAVSCFVNTDGDDIIKDVREKQGELLQVISREINNNVEGLTFERLLLILSSIINLSIRGKKGVEGLRRKDVAGKTGNILEELNSQYEDAGFSKRDILRMISWLESCKIIGYCNKKDVINNTGKSNARFYFTDLGILSYVADVFGTKLSDLDGLLSETFVYQSLIFPGFTERFRGVVPSFGIAQQYEYDFMVVSRADGKTYTIEVKNGKNSNTDGLSLLLEKNCTDYVVYYKGLSGNGRKGNTITIPLWLAFRFDYSLGLADSSSKQQSELAELEKFLDINKWETD